MAQEDRGLVLRGLLLFAGVGGLAAFVLTMLFWQPSTNAATLDPIPVTDIPAVVLPCVGEFPAGVSWYAIYKLGETMPSAPGSDIRYNAAITLARRGSPAVPWHTIREMLDEDLQMRNNRVPSLEDQVDGPEVYDEAAARGTMISALRALAVWHEKQVVKQANPQLLRIYPLVDRLIESPFVEMKTQAEKARATFFR